MRAIRRERANLKVCSVPNLSQAARGDESHNPACSLAQQRQRLRKERHLPCCDNAVSHAGRTAHGHTPVHLWALWYVKGCQRESWDCVPQKICAALSYKHARIQPLLGFQTLISAPPRHFKGVPPYCDQITAVTALILFFLTKILLCMYSSMQ